MGIPLFLLICLLTHTHTYSNGKFLAGIGFGGPRPGGVGGTEVTMARYVHECSELIVECEIPEEQNRKQTESGLLDQCTT